MAASAAAFVIHTLLCFFITFSFWPACRAVHLVFTCRAFTQIAQGSVWSRRSRGRFERSWYLDPAEPFVIVRQGTGAGCRTASPPFRVDAARVVVPWRVVWYAMKIRGPPAGDLD